MKNKYSLTLTVPGKGTKLLTYTSYTNLKDAQKAANLKTKSQGAACFITVVDDKDQAYSNHCQGRACWTLKKQQAATAKLLATDGVSMFVGVSGDWNKITT